MFLRRALVVLPLTAGLISVTALPALAVPVGCAVTTAGASVVQVCVDQNGNNRAAYVQAQAPGQVTMTIHRIRLEQCNNGGNPLSCSNVVLQSGPFTVGSFAMVSYTGNSYPVQFGHTYRGCATVTVNGQFYGEVCSVLVAN